MHPTAYRFAAFAVLRTLRPLRCLVGRRRARAWFGERQTTNDSF